MTDPSPSNLFKKPAFVQGMLAGLPFILIIVPFGLLFGVVASEAGLSDLEAMAMTTLVIAGAAQFTAIQLMVENAPVAVVILTALAVNMRMAMYSASMVPHVGAAKFSTRMLIGYFLVDQTYGLAIKRYQEEPPIGLPEKLQYFFGSVLVICPFWYVFSYLGTQVGEAIPESYALDFAVPITFIALVAPSLRSLPHLAAAVSSVVFALLFAGFPFSSGLMLAACISMVIGAQVETWLERRA